MAVIDPIGDTSPGIGKAVSDPRLSQNE
jgi:hypothetical protein